MVYSQSFRNRANKSAAVKGLPIFHKACPGVGKGIPIPALERMSPNPNPKILKNRSQSQNSEKSITIPKIWDWVWDPGGLGSKC